VVCLKQQNNGSADSKLTLAEQSAPGRLLSAKCRNRMMPRCAGASGATPRVTAPIAAAPSKMSLLDLSAQIDAVKQELDGIDDAVRAAMRDRNAMQVSRHKPHKLADDTMLRDEHCLTSSPT